MMQTPEERRLLCPSQIMFRVPIRQVRIGERIGGNGKKRVRGRTEMKERPILFSAPMVRAILAGTKTQTRRIVKLPPAPMHLGDWEPTTIGGEGCFQFGGGGERIPVKEEVAIWHTRTGKCICCPHGVPGDRLWVRESFKLETLLEDIPAGNLIGSKDPVLYVADDSVRGEPIDDFGRFRSGRFMPRWASRITLELTAVRVERLNDISETDAEAEGITDEDALVGQISNPYRTAYADLWESINGAGSWAKAPWVWVEEFKVISK